MKYEEYIRILNPETSSEALAEIEYKAGFKGEKAKLDAINEARIEACRVLNKQMQLGKIIKEMRANGEVSIDILDRVLNS